jgi:hypothetical protein
MVEPNTEPRTMLTILFSSFLEIAMQLDDAGVRKEYGLTVERAGKKQLKISATRENFLKFRKALVADTYNADLSFASSARAALKRVDAELNARYYVIDTIQGDKLGDFGDEEAAAIRAANFNSTDGGRTLARYVVRRVVGK